MEKHTCEECGKEFKTSESLAQHKDAKHTVVKAKKTSSISSKKIRNWGIFLLVIGGFLALIFWTVAGANQNLEDCQNLPAEEINIGSHSNLAMHIHPNIEIVIDGQKELIPANIGISPGVMRPIHTHDSSGEIHVEGPCERTFSLGDFFDVWNREFSSEGIFGNSAENGTLTVTVDGEENVQYESLVLRDGQNILIEYDSN